MKNAYDEEDSEDDDERQYILVEPHGHFYASRECRGDAGSSQAYQNHMRGGKPGQLTVSDAHEQNDAESRHNHAQNGDRRSKGASCPQANIESEIYRICAWKHLSDGETSKKIFFTKPAATLDGLPMHHWPGRSPE